MNRSPFPSGGCPLFGDESKIWDSLDKATQEEVLDRLALLLLRHLQQTAPYAAAELPLADTHATESPTDIHNIVSCRKECST